MIRSALLTDGSLTLRTMVRPGSAFAELAARPRFAVALAFVTGLALLAAAVTAPRTDHGPGLAEMAMAGDGQPAPEPTQFQREESAATARKLGLVIDWTTAALAPTMLALLTAASLAAGFRVAGARASLRASLAVAAHGTLPIWLARVLAVPAVLAHAPIPAADVSRLLPSSAAALLPESASPILAGALGALDLFSLWAVWLLALGMARITGATRTRALITTAVLYLAFLALFRIALPSFAVFGAPRANG